MQKSGHIIGPGHTFQSITNKITDVVLTRSTPKSWFAGMAIGMALLLLLGYALFMLFSLGVGIWGINSPVGWGFAIVCLVWWIGIGHAGTLISAILLLFRQEWRTSINRFAEAMTLFAVSCAGLFPIIHMGRPWLAYWIFPYPNTFDLWPQFRSPLVWDAFAIAAYSLVSMVFWYVGLIPDLAAMRDRAEHPVARYGYGLLALGWRGSAHHWQRYDSAYLLLAALATPLVVSVCSIVSFDFAAGLLPGWHSTIFPTYFLGGAIFSGFAMVLTLLIPLRKLYQFEDFITLKHLDTMAKIMLATGLFVSYCYLTESFTAWYSGNDIERYWLFNRTFGPSWWAFAGVMVCNVLVPQALWLKACRTNPRWLFGISVMITIGMWLERYMIIVGSLKRDFIPAAWGTYAGTAWDWATFLGTVGLFLVMILFFVRLLPMISIFEMRHLQAELDKRQNKKAIAQTRSAPSAESIKTAKETMSGRPLYGIMAEFPDAATLVETAQTAHAMGYRNISAYSPFPIEALPKALGLRPTRLPYIVLFTAIGAALLGFFMQYYAAVIDYPWNVGGRPLNSWPAFLIVTFEIVILAAGVAAAGGMLLRNGLPQLYHAVFNAPRFKYASQNRFFLCIEAHDPLFNQNETWSFLETLKPFDIVLVEK